MQAVDHPLKIHSEEAGQKSQREKNGSDDRQAVDDLCLFIGNTRSITLHCFSSSLAQVIDPIHEVRRNHGRNLPFHSFLTVS